MTPVEVGVDRTDSVRLDQWLQIVTSHGHLPAFDDVAANYHLSLVSIDDAVSVCAFLINF